jgi:hypothetical protein
LPLLLLQLGINSTRIERPLGARLLANGATRTSPPQGFRFSVQTRQLSGTPLISLGLKSEIPVGIFPGPDPDLRSISYVERDYTPPLPFPYPHPPFTERRKGDLFSDVKSRKSRRKSHHSTNDRLRSVVLSPLVGYMRVSKADGSQVLDLQKDALTSAGVPERNIYSDTASGKKDDRPGLDACLKALKTASQLSIGAAPSRARAFATL